MATRTRRSLASRSASSRAPLLASTTRASSPPDVSVSRQSSYSASSQQRTRSPSRSVQQSAAAVVQLEGLRERERTRDRSFAAEESKEGGGGHGVALRGRRPCLVTSNKRMLWEELEDYVATNKDNQVAFNPWHPWHNVEEEGEIRFMPHLAVAIAFHYYSQDLVPRNAPEWAFYPVRPGDLARSLGQEEGPPENAAPEEKRSGSGDEQAEERQDESVEVVEPVEGEAKAKAKKAAEKEALLPEHSDPYFHEDGFPDERGVFNGDDPWYVALQHNEPWISAFPNPVHRVPEILEFEWHVMLGEGFGVLDASEYIQRVFQTSGRGCLSIKLPHHRLRDLMQDGTTHIVPYAIFMTGETNSLPLPMSAQLYTSTAEGVEVPWFTPVVPNPDTKGDPSVLGHLVTPGRPQSLDRLLKYQADGRRVGCADYARWASTDFAALDAEMLSDRYKSATFRTQMYEIPGPLDKATHAETVPQFVCMDSYQLLKRNAQLRQFKGNLRTEVIYNGVKERHGFRVHHELFWDVVNHYRNLVDRDATQMRVDRDWRFELSLLSTDKQRVNGAYRDFYQKVSGRSVRLMPELMTPELVAESNKPLSATEPDLTVRYGCVLHVMFAKVPVARGLRPQPSTP